VNAARVMAQLVRDEGLRLKPYRCTAGRLTIGVGRNLDDRGITENEAMLLLQNDVADVWSRLVADLCWVGHAPEAVQEALVNMAFNLGEEGLLGFGVTLGHLRAARYPEAARAMLDSRWARQVGARAERLAALVGGIGAG
jgi:lysozyme